MHGGIWESGSLPSRPKEKALVSAAIVLYAAAGYFAVGLSGDPLAASSLQTSWDDAIPFWPGAMYAYEGVYTAMLYPLFVVRCQRLFRRVALAYTLLITLSLVFWLAYPVSAHQLRPSLDGLDLSVFHNWGLKVNYTLDPPLNCFPSLHMGIALLASLVCYRARPLFGLFGLAGASLVAVSIVTVKQHFLADGILGGLLAVGLYFLLVHRYDPGEAKPEEVHYSWRGPAGYLALHAGVTLAFFLAFLAGWKPWEG